MRQLAAAFLIVVLACSGHVTSDRWQKMTVSEKQLYVSSLIGGEKEKNAKGGTGHRYTRPPEHYVARIDDAYARGDGRDPDVIFAGLDDTRPTPPTH